MRLDYLSNGSLNPGLHPLSWKEFNSEFGYNMHRQRLLTGMKALCMLLKKHGCQYVYMDGSFTTKKEKPNDYDGCWRPAGVNIGALLAEEPLIAQIAPPRHGQKAAYFGEIFPSTAPGGPGGITMLDFFQKDRDDIPKGIVVLDLNTIL